MLCMPHVAVIGDRFVQTAAAAIYSPSARGKRGMHVDMHTCCNKQILLPSPPAKTAGLWRSGTLAPNLPTAVRCISLFDYTPTNVTDSNVREYEYFSFYYWRGQNRPVVLWLDSMSPIK